MKHSITAEQVLRDIEFELIQGIVPHNELGSSIQAVRKFQNQARADAFRSGRRKADYQEIAGRQFQINDMLLTLLQEMAVQLQALQLEWERAGRVLHPPFPSASIPEPLPSEPGSGRPTGSGPSLSVSLAEGERGQFVVDKIAAMRLEELRVEREVRPVRIPVIGRWLTRARAALHRLPLFYVGRLANKQTAINRMLWDSIMELNQMLVHHQQQLQILLDRLPDRTVPSNEDQDPPANSTLLP